MDMDERDCLLMVGARWTKSTRPMTGRRGGGPVRKECDHGPEAPDKKIVDHMSFADREGRRSSCGLVGQGRSETALAIIGDLMGSHM